MLPMDAARPSIQDGSEARDEVVHACCESESGSSDDSRAKPLKLGPWYAMFNFHVTRWADGDGCLIFRAGAA